MRIQLWAAFFLHDIGYWGKPNMDGEEGRTHPELGAKVMGWLFGRKWAMFTICHSRYYAKEHGLIPSRLCVADKLIPYYTPAWLYLFQSRLTGEIMEYMIHAEGKLKFVDDKTWLAAFNDYMRSWCAIHKATASKEPS